MQKRENGDYVPSTQELTHIQETLQLLSTMTNDHRFEDAYNEDDRHTKGGFHTMCNVLDRIENQGRAEGEDKMALLIKKLFEQNRIEDAKRASEDKAYREQLMKELSIE